jgi:hypothetical protein
MTTTIEAGVASAYCVFKGVPHQSPAADRDWTLDITFNCRGYGPDGVANQGVAIAYATASGEIPFVDFTPTATAYASISATPIWGNAYEGTVTAYASFSADLLLEGIRQNWVKWSNIGNLDFTIWKDNVAGERPLDWKGWVYCVKKLKSRVIVYGENGVSLLTPSDVHFGLNTIYRIGLKSKNAVTGDDAVHFFIDNKDQLFSMGENLELLGYSEYLSDMTDPVMSYDVENSLVYICDGTYGFVYSPKDKSLGSGPVNVTGLSSQGGTLYVVSPATIVTPPFEIWTDIHDMGTRKNKTVFEVEYGTDLSGPFQAAIDYRRDKAGSFTRTPWYEVSERGSAFITAMGREFKFGARVLAYEYLDVDYITIKGIVHAH